MLVHLETGGLLTFLFVFPLPGTAEAMNFSPQADVGDSNGPVPVDIMCGPNCLWQIAFLNGKDYELGAIASLARTDPYQGTSVAGMLDALAEIGIPAQAVRLTTRDLKKEDRPIILLLERSPVGHYVLYAGARESQAHIIDGKDSYTISYPDLEQQWNGVGILVDMGETHGGIKPNGVLSSSAAFVKKGIPLLLLLFIGSVMVYGRVRSFMHRGER